MKRLLSIILALAMLIEPVGVIFCFAAGRTPEEVHMDLIRLMNEQELGKVRVIATLLIDGTMNIQIAYFDRDGRFIKNVDVKEEDYEDLEKEIQGAEVLGKLRGLNLSVAQIIYEVYVKGNSDVNIYYLDSIGRIKCTEYEN